MDETYRGYKIRVYPEPCFANESSSKWIFDIYRKSDDKFVNDSGISGSEFAAIADACKWIDEQVKELRKRKPAEAGSVTQLITVRRSSRRPALPGHLPPAADRARSGARIG